MTTNASDSHRPLPVEERQGIALCLSGGGYRAALFHLGVLTRLNEAGALSLIDTISAVSGGSILAAHLVTALPTWPEPGTRVPEAQWATISSAFQNFTHHDVRTQPVLRRFLTPWRVDTAVRVLAMEYQNRLRLGKLDDTRERPRLIINATDMQFGVDWTFDSGDRTHPARCGDPQAGHTNLPDWPLGRAVAASSCFPPLFNPLRVGSELGHRLTGGLYPGNISSDQHPHTAALPPSSTLDPAALRAQLSLSDGGVYDNLGIGPVWRDHRHIIVSDGGSVFGPARDTGLLSRLKRYEAIASHGGSAVRRQWLLANLESGEMEGTYLAIGSSPEDYPKSDLHYPRDIITDLIARIRTDLDEFSNPEQAVLINHGYSLADAALQSWMGEFVQPGTRDPGWPFPEWATNLVAVQKELRHSDKRKLLGLKLL